MDQRPTSGASLPAIAFALATVLVGLGLLLLAVFLRLEFMGPGAQYFCGEPRTQLCIPSYEFALSVTTTPFVVIFLFVLFPAIFGALIPFLFTPQSPKLKKLLSVGLWLALAFYLAAPLVYLFLPGGSLDASAEDWVTHPFPYSITRGGILAAIDLNQMALLVLLWLCLAQISIHIWAQPVRTVFKLFAIAIGSTVIFYASLAISRLTSSVYLHAVDRNSEFSFFDPMYGSNGSLLQDFISSTNTQEFHSFIVLICLLSFCALFVLRMRRSATKLALTAFFAISYLLSTFIMLEYIYTVGICLRCIAHVG